MYSKQLSGRFGPEGDYGVNSEDKPVFSAGISTASVHSSRSPASLRAGSSSVSIAARLWATTSD